MSVDVGMEGLVAPSKFYSALSSGRPVAVICEKHSYLRQLVSEANCGAAFDNGDSKGLAGFIRYLIKDSQVNQQFGTAGHRFIQSNFTPELISKQYLKILQRAVLKDADLRRAVAQQEFCLEYQPIITLGNSRIRGFEALLRWQHPQRGILHPAEFLSAIEETGLIIPLGWWLLNQACHQLRQWQMQISDEHTLGISINLSTCQFLQPDLIPQIDRILDSNTLKGSCLTLQISEESLMVDPAAATAILMQLRSRHIQVCLDGFGKGVASLSYLHRFPITSIEIDRSLVSRLETDAEVAKLIGTIVALAQDLEIDVSAEGFETLNQVQKLKTIGIQQGQGYWFSPAIQPENILDLLKQHNQPRFIASEPSKISDLADSTPCPTTPLVLIADDEKLMRTLLRRAIEKEGYRVVEAESGEQALILYRQLQPDMVLLDAMMPEMDGFDCCSQLRQVVAGTIQSTEIRSLEDGTATLSDNQSNLILGAVSAQNATSTAVVTVLNHCPVMIITSLDDVDSVDRAFEVGATDYITKPVNWAVFRQRLHRLLAL
ncbi:MAG: EAL domain-containing protein [Leptolyngbyaceae cyanobacterium CRU_2_3]|nr:EAL domain-containing protein [Leptolyngbyaceae cyanobacterium CRU_2_3]